MAKPKLLDLFCCAGGAAMGYHRAGFDVTGVDIAHQKNYPFQFHQADWKDYFLAHHQDFDVFHASPPCQGYSVTKSLSKSKAPKLISEVRRVIQKTGKPYIIENVMGARREMHNPLQLRGNMFGLQVIRDRLFEISPFLLCNPPPPVNGSTSSHRGSNRLKDSSYITVTGQNFLVDEARGAMGIDWMVGKELAQSIPPAYTEWIGTQLMRVCFSQEIAA